MQQFSAVTVSLKSGFLFFSLKNLKNLKFGLERFFSFFIKNPENLGFYSPFLQPCQCVADNCTVLQQRARKKLPADIKKVGGV